MKIIRCDEDKFYNDFLPIIIDLDCSDKYNPNNIQHIDWIKHKVHISFINCGVALYAYTDDN